MSNKKALEAINSSNVVVATEGNGSTGVTETFTVDKEHAHSCGFSDADIEAYYKAVEAGQKAVANIKTETMRAISILYIVDSRELYKMDDCDSIAEFSEKRLNLAPSTCCTYLKIVERFMEESEPGKLVFRKEYSGYENYGISQLMEMSSIKDEKMLKTITPDMTVTKIREIKKSAKSPLLNGKKEPKLDTATPAYDRTFNSLEDFQADSDSFKNALEKAKEADPNVMIRVLIERTA